MGMPASTPPAAPATTAHRPLSRLLTAALVLAGLSAVCLVVVLVAAAAGRVLWAGFTIFPAVFFPVAFLLVCLELLRGARRRSNR